MRLPCLPARRLRLRFAPALLLCLAAWTWAGAQSNEGTTPKAAQAANPAASTGEISGQITDPSGALVAGARLTLRSDGLIVKIGSSDSRGRYAFGGLAPGRYSLNVDARSFRVAEREIDLKGREEVSVDVQLEIGVQRQQVAVSGEGFDSNPDHNMGAVVLRGEDLAALATNSADLKQQLTAMAGTDVSPQFYVDGFSASRLPPKSAIREIRMNQDPYSAQYDTPGAERIEIITKAGGNKLHGDLELLGEDSALNAGNPYVESQPPYSAFYSQGDVNGPLSKNSSWFLTGAEQNVGAQSFIHAIISPTGPAYTQTVSSPQTGIEAAPRVDFEIGKAQIVSVRYDITHQMQDDLLQSQLSLESQAVNTRHTDQVVQISDTQTYSERFVNETRFQFMRVNDSSAAQNGSASVLVQGAFNGGGNNLGQAYDGQNRYELQDYASLLRGNHLLHFGGRVRDVQEGNTSTAGYNGQFIFSSINAYDITQAGIANGLTPAEIRALGGGASQFSVTAGQTAITVNVADVGVYFEDEWKISANMTLAPGLRYEAQTGIPDHADFAPRLSYAWAVGAKNGKPAKMVLRAGAGLFYQRFPTNLILNADRQNGVLQQQYVVNNPDFYPNLPTPDELGPATLPTIYEIDPRLRAPSLLQASMGIEKQFFKKLSVSTDYTYYRGIDQLLTRNINAPLPGTYNPNDPTSGVRPLGTLQNVYQYESEAESRHNQLYVNMRYTIKRLQLYGYYILSKHDTDTQGASSFPSEQYNLQADYGRAANDLRNRGYLGGLARLPWNVVVNPFLIVESSIPFNITIDQDLNGDSQFNQRPAFATDLNRPSVYKTQWGNFDADPLPGQTIIPINYGVGPSFVMLNLSVSKNIPFGPKTSEQPKPGAKAAAPEFTRPYQLSLGMEAQNIFNTVNGGLPVGVLGSQLFGQSTGLATTQFSNTQANRILYLHMTLTF